MQSNEQQLNLALNAKHKNPKLSLRKASQIYKVDRSTLSQRQQGRPSKRDCIPKSRKLTNLEEETIVRKVLELDSQAFPPRIRGVEDMANRLRHAREKSPVGKNWTANFIKRQPALRTRFSRRYDYQRALCEDPEVIQGWFDLVRNFMAKHGIVVEDIYNFDETGFLMGQITTTTVVTGSDKAGNPKLAQPGNREWVSVIQGVNSQGWAIPPFIIVKGRNHLASWYQNSPFPPDWSISVSENGWTTNDLALDWIQHFNKYTKARTKGKYRLLVLDGHESHHSIAFEEYCKENNILTLCMPPHSSHLLQPLDIGCFGPLKKAYSGQIEAFMRNRITHISKDDFFPAFKHAFDTAMTSKNIQGGFRGAGLVPFDPQNVISKLDVKLRTPIPSRPASREAFPWVSKTPQNTIEASSQSTFIKSRIASHQNSSPTSIYNAMDQFAKGAQKIMHSMTLLQSENAELREANRVLSKRRRAKKTRIRQGGTLTIQDVQDLETQKDVDQQLQQEESGLAGRMNRTERRKRRCGNCGQPNHNARTCTIVIEASEEENSA